MSTLKEHMHGLHKAKEKPVKLETSNQTLRLPPKLKEQAIKKAAKSNRSLTQHIIMLLEQDLTPNKK